MRFHLLWPLTEKWNWAWMIGNISLKEKLYHNMIIGWHRLVKKGWLKAKIIDILCLKNRLNSYMRSASYWCHWNSQVFMINLSWHFSIQTARIVVLTFLPECVSTLSRLISDVSLRLRFVKTLRRTFFGATLDSFLCVSCSKLVLFTVFFEKDNRKRDNVYYVSNFFIWWV